MNEAPGRSRAAGCRALRAALAVGGCGAALALLASPAAAKKKQVIDVKPGKADAIQRAVDRAQPGTTIRIARGRYPENVVIAKKLSLVAAGKSRPIVDGGCETQFTISVRHAGVILRHLKVVGADEGFGPFPAEVDFTDVAAARAEGLVLRDTCDAEYGINVLRSAGIVMVDNEARGGFSDTGIYIGAITSGVEGAPGPLIAKRNLSYGNNRGIIVEDSGDVDMRITGNVLHNNDAGLYVTASNGVLFRGNTIHDNASYGMHFVNGSADNRIDDNSFSDNGSDFLDEGGPGNCGSGNMPGGIVPACL